ncbi:hypothetical protein TWF281_009210 [Arthrobotrys megalospora]
MDSISQNKNEQEYLPDISPITQEESEQQGPDPVAEEEQTDDQDPELPHDDETEVMKTGTLADDTKKGKGKKGKAASKPKKTSDKSKEPPSKKRKRSGDQEGNKENEDKGHTKKETGLEDGEDKAGKGGTRRKKGEAEAWTDDIDKVLVTAIKKYTNNNVEAVIPWKETYKDFQDAFPGSQRTLMSLKNRWFQHLKHGEVELTEEQTAHFKQAVRDINGNERNAAIAWRYKQLTNCDINKGAVGKLLKSLNLG